MSVVDQPSLGISLRILSGLLFADVFASEHEPFQKLSSGTADPLAGAMIATIQTGKRNHNGREQVLPSIGILVQYLKS